jgi:glycosyltransferase involved in cell wall biosynthesis
MKYNILRVSTFPTIEKSGMGLHPAKLCGIKGFDTFYLMPYENSSRLFYPENTQLVEKSFLMEVRPKNVALMKKIFFIMRRLFSLVIFSLKGIQLLMMKKVDIVHIHSPMYILIALVGYLARKKVYITFHGTDFYRIKNARWYQLFSNIFDKVFIISPDMNDALSKIHGKDKVIQVQNGIDLDIYENYNMSRKKQIIAVGSLKEEKGFSYLISAFSKIINDNKDLEDYQLIIAGDGLLRSDLEEQIRVNNMQQHIFLVGHKNQKEIIQLYNESEVFVLSSISEGFPKVILESMSCGCKIVATDVGSISTILMDTNFEIVKPHDAIQLKEAIVRTIKNRYPDYRNILDKYTWDNVRNIYKNIYEKDLNVHT